MNDNNYYLTEIITPLIPNPPLDPQVKYCMLFMINVLHAIILHLIHNYNCYNVFGDMKFKKTIKI